MLFSNKKTEEIRNIGFVPRPFCSLSLVVWCGFLRPDCFNGDPDSLSFPDGTEDISNLRQSSRKSINSKHFVN